MNSRPSTYPIDTKRLDSIIKATEFNKYWSSKSNQYIKRMQDIAVESRDYPSSIIYCKICFRYKSEPLDSRRMASDLIKEFGKFGDWHDKECPCFNYQGDKDMSGTNNIVENQNKVIEVLREALYNAKVALDSYGHQSDSCHIELMQVIDKSLDMKVE